jgi:hypothetical protein
MGMKFAATLREEYRLKVHGNKVLRRIFRRKRESTRGGRRKTDNEELHNLFFDIYN